MSKVNNPNKINIPIPGRTFEIAQGCWNCTGRATPEVSFEHWKRASRPAEEARIAGHKQRVAAMPADPAAVLRLRQTGRNALCPCGSGQKYKRCHARRDEAANELLKQAEGIAMAAVHLDRFEKSILQRDPILGIQGLCTEKTSEKCDGFTADNYLCDRWSGVQGASIARAGAALDPTSEERKDRIGDGN